MAIDDFAKTLLSNVVKERERKEREARKREKKDALKSLFFKGAVSIGNATLQRATNRFLQSEEFLRNNMQFKKGYNIANDYITNEKSARDNSLGYEDYWNHKATKEDVAEVMERRYGDKSGYDKSDWRELTEQVQKNLGSSLRKNHEEGLKKAQDFIYSTGDKGEKAYTDFVKQTRPSNIKELLTNTATDLIGGKDLNVVARELKRKQYIDDAESLIVFDKSFTETGSARIAEMITEESKKLNDGKGIRRPAPVITEEFLDLGGTDVFQNPLGKQKVLKVTHWDKSVKYITPDGLESVSKEKASINSQFTQFVAMRSGTDQSSVSTQNYGMQTMTNYGLPDDRKFFKDQAEQLTRKISGRDKTKAQDQYQRNVHANIAGLQMVLSGKDYNLSEPESGRVAVKLYKNKTELNNAQQEEGIYKVNPYTHANTLGIALTMSDLNRTEEFPRRFSEEDIKQVVSTPIGQLSMFEDYQELTPKSMKVYDKLVKETNNPFLLQVHERVKGLVDTAKKNPSVTDLQEIEKLYNISLKEKDKIPKSPLEPKEKSKEPIKATDSLISAMPRPPVLPKFSTETAIREHKKLYGNQQKAYEKVLKAKENLDTNTKMTKRKGLTTSFGMASASTVLDKLYNDYMLKFGESN